MSNLCVQSAVWRWRSAPGWRAARRTPLSLEPLSPSRGCIGGRWGRRRRQSGTSLHVWTWVGCFRDFFSFKSRQCYFYPSFLDIFRKTVRVLLLQRVVRSKVWCLHETKNFKTKKATKIPLTIVSKPWISFRTTFYLPVFHELLYRVRPE